MDLRQHPRQPALALTLARYLQALAGPGGIDALDALILPDANTKTKSMLVAATADAPAYYAFESGTTVVVLIGGSTSYGMASATMAGYQGTLTASRTNPANAYFRTTATNISNNLGASNYPAAKRWLLAGHSLGGSVCEILTADRVADGHRNNTAVCTFGAPKPGDVELTRHVDIDYRARWMNSDDPVPLLPPTTADTLAVLLAYPYWQLLRFGNFVHPSGGVQIDASAIVTQAQLPRDASINAAGSLVGWWLAVDGSSASGHHLATYISRLARWVQEHPVAPPTPSGASAQRPEGSGNRRLATRAEQTLANNITALAHRQAQGDPVIPETQLFKYRRVGRTHTVYFAAALVAVCGTKRGARALAREWNSALHLLQRSAVVDADSMRIQLGTFLALAQEAGAGFSPQMNTTLPTAP